VPPRYWRDVEKHWVSCQQPNGMWGYKNPGSGFGMTMAGITALSVCRDFMSEATTQPTTQSTGQPAGPHMPAPRSAALERALQWFESGDNSINIDPFNFGYSLYGLERAALASGMMFAGVHDIYRELALRVVQSQKTDGSWGEHGDRESVIDTSFCLLFLAR